VSEIRPRITPGSPQDHPKRQGLPALIICMDSVSTLEDGTVIYPRVQVTPRASDNAAHVGRGSVHTQARPEDAHGTSV
jgi:hypothetical protein